MKTSYLSLREEVDEKIFRVYFREIELGELNVPQLRSRWVRALLLSVGHNTRELSLI